MMSNYKTNSAIGTPSSTSNHAPGGNGMSLAPLYLFPIFLSTFFAENFLK